MHSFIDEKMTHCKLNKYERTVVLSLRYLTTKKNNQNHTEHFNPYTIYYYYILYPTESQKINIPTTGVMNLKRNMKYSTVLPFHSVRKIL